MCRKQRDRRGRDHPTGRKRPVEVMVGVGGGGSQLLSDGCWLHMHTDTNTQHAHTASQPAAFRSRRPAGAGGTQLLPRHALLDKFTYRQLCCAALGFCQEQIFEGKLFFSYLFFSYCASAFVRDVGELIRSVSCHDSIMLPCL